MDLLFTAIQLVILIACVLALTRTERIFDACRELRGEIESTCARILEERSRLTGLERDVDALRRELRKLSGKFYAAQREAQDDAEDLDTYANDLTATHNLIAHANRASICDNWSVAQIAGPNSDAASCECSYCVGRRAERRALRAALVPKTVQGQAEIAKLNAGKP